MLEKHGRIAFATISRQSSRLPFTQSSRRAPQAAVECRFSIFRRMARAAGSTPIQPLRPPAARCPAMTHTDDKTLDELDQFLMSDIMSENTMTIEMLDGYLSAIAIGPVTIAPTEWLADVWGPSEDDAPDFESYEQAEHVFNLMMRHYNAILQTFDKDPSSIAPLFSVNEVGEDDDAHEYIDAEAWANGFFQGMGLRWDDWQPLLEHPEADEWLRPLRLLGGDELSEEERELVAVPAEREKLSEQVPPSVLKIHEFWLPHRAPTQERLLAQTIQRDTPKVGRNDPCPCGSGKKHKKCCGTDDGQPD